MVLGFDLRPAEVPAWDEGRRKLFLLRQDIARPLSIDVLVWPSLFARAGEQGTEDIPVPDWIGPNASLWENLEEMRAWLDARDVDRSGAAVVAVGWLSKLGFSDPQGPYPEAGKPSRPQGGWELLGYDVADRWLLSGLSNCGWERAEVRPPAAWSNARLNEHHLFQHPEAAFEYVEAANSRVPEHAPFFVYSLYRLPS